eukprot:gene7223-8391_t
MTTDDMLALFGQLDITKVQPQSPAITVDKEEQEVQEEEEEESTVTKDSVFIDDADDNQVHQVVEFDEDDEDEEEESARAVDPNAVVELGQDETSDPEDVDPDPVEFDPEDLNDPSKYKELHEKIRTRNSRQRVVREQQLNNMFDRITNGAPPPYFEKRRKKQPEQRAFGDVQDDQLRERLVKLAGAAPLSSQIFEDSANENPLLPIDAPTTSTTTTTTTTNSTPSKPPLTPSKDTTAKLSLTRIDLHRKLRDILTGFCVLNAKAILAQPTPEIPLLLVSIVRLSLFNQSIYDSVPKNEEGRKFNEMLAADMMASTVIKQLNVEVALKTYQSVTQDQWLSSKVHNRKTLEQIHFVAQLLPLVVGKPIKILSVIADIPSIFKSLATANDLNAIIDLAKSVLTGHPSELDIFSAILKSFQHIINAPPKENILIKRFFSPEIQSLISNKNEFDGKLNPYKNNGYLESPYKGNKNNNNNNNNQRMSPNKNVNKNLFNHPPTTTTTTTTTTAQQQPQPQQQPIAIATDGGGSGSDYLNSKPASKSSNIVKKGIALSTQEYITTFQSSLASLTDEEKMQRMMALLATQQQQLETLKIDNQRLTTNNEVLFQNLEKYVIWHNNIKSKWEEHASFMSHTMTFNLHSKR